MKNEIKDPNRGFYKPIRNEETGKPKPNVLTASKTMVANQFVTITMPIKEEAAGIKIKAMKLYDGTIAFSEEEFKKIMEFFKINFEMKEDKTENFNPQQSIQTLNTD